MLECPNCGELLTPINVATTGGQITVDHCLNCGGTWFDPYEINRLKIEDVHKIGWHLTIKKNDIPWGKMERLCPKDFHELKIEKPDIIKENVSIERCHVCHGIFISQENLLKVKMAQQEKISTYKRLSLPFSLTAVFIPFVFVSLLMFSTFMTITRLDDAQNSQIKAAEEIQALQFIPITDSTVSILFLTKSETTTSIEYGTNILDQKTVTIDETPSKTHQTNLKNLNPGTLYRFRIIIDLKDGRKVKSKEFTFTTK